MANLYLLKVILCFQLPFIVYLFACLLNVHMQIYLSEAEALHNN